jgi:hypothetical protein
MMVNDSFSYPPRTTGEKAAAHSALETPVMADAHFCGTEPARL